MRRIAVLLALLAITTAPAPAHAAPPGRDVAGPNNTGILAPPYMLTLETDTTIDTYRTYKNVRFPAGQPVVVGVQGASFFNVLFPAGVTYQGTQSISQMRNSTVVGGITLNSTRGQYFDNVEITRATYGVNITASLGTPAYNTGLDLVWVHDPLTGCALPPAMGVRLQGAQGFVMDRSTVDMGGWEVGQPCGTDLIDAAFKVVDGVTASDLLGVSGSDLNGGAITFQRSIVLDFDVYETWIGPDYHYSPQGFPPPGPPVDSRGNKLVVLEPTRHLEPLTIL